MTAHKHYPDTDTAGLCARCTHLRIIRSDRGSTFYLCRRSATDPAYPQYPRLPVMSCRGYETGVHSGEKSGACHPESA